MVLIKTKLNRTKLLPMVVLVLFTISCTNGSVSMTSTFRAPTFSSNVSSGVTVNPRTTSLKIEGQCDAQTKRFQYSLDSGATWKDLTPNTADDVDCSDKDFAIIVSDLYKGFLGTVEFGSTESKTFKLRSLAGGEISDASDDLTIQYSPNWCTANGAQSAACSADQGTFWASEIDADLIATNIKSGVSIFGVTGNVTPAYAACSEDSGTVNAAQCSTSANRYVSSVVGANITLWNNPTQSTSVTSTIPDGYYKTKSITFTDADLVASKILTGVDIFGVTGNVIAAYANCTNNSLNATACSTAVNSYVSTTLGNNVSVSGSTSSTIPIGFYDGATSCSISDANLIANNIKLGKTILGISGTFDGIVLNSNAHRNRATAPISQIAESLTYAGVNLPAGYRDVPTIATDDDGYVAADTSSSQAVFVKRDTATGAEWNAGVSRNVCGKGVNASLVNKIADCDSQHSSKPNWDAGVAGRVSWNGATNGNAGQGSWTLVTVYSSSLNNGDVCDLSCKEVWRDDRTGLMWSDHLASDNWCKASGNTETADPSNFCNDITYQPAYNAGTPAAESWCAETGPSIMNEVTGNGEVWAAGTYHAAKGGLGKNSSISVRWRLPTKFDFGSAESNGLRFVVPGMAAASSGTLEWSATIKASDRNKAFTFHGLDGSIDSGTRTSNYAVRCVGR